MMAHWMGAKNIESNGTDGPSTTYCSVVSPQVEIPLMDDPVSKVEHIGRETMKKLADLRIAALENGVPEVAAALDENTARIETGVHHYIYFFY